MHQFIANLAIIFSLALPSAVACEEKIEPLIHPGNRYARENITIDRLAYWDGPVEAQIIGEIDKETQKTLLSDVLYLGRASRSEIQVHGFPNSIFSDSKLAADARIVILSYEPRYESSLRDGLKAGERLGNVDLSNAHPAISNILGSGLVQQAEGCFAKWQASSSNEIQGIVLAASNALQPADRQVCFDNLIPAAFGISPVLSRYDARLATSRQRPERAVIFEDRSEFVLELSASATCRLDLNDFGMMCPFNLINKVFAHHAYIGSLEIE